MKKSILLFAAALFSGAGAYACTHATIESMISPINTYKPASVGSQTAAALEALSLCDENLNYAGQLLGQTFNTYKEDSTQIMAAAIVARRHVFSSDFINGLGLGMIKTLNLYKINSTYYMLNTIVRIAEFAPENAKPFALTLMQQQNPYQKEANDLLLQAVSTLRQLAAPPPPPPNTPPPAPAPLPSSIWAFRSNSSGCENVSGPWGLYELCPRYYASVSDQQGNRVVLACKAENYGIEFRVSLAQSNWSRLARLDVQTLAFGTSSLVQSLGVPYVIPRDRALMAEEPVASEVLDLLRRANSLIINVRANSGEVNMRLNFTLKGSNAAITQLLQHCR